MSSLQPSLVVSADRQEIDSISDYRTVCQIGRSAITCSNLSNDLLKLIDLKVYRFPYAVDDETWRTQVSSVFVDTKMHNPLFLVEPCGYALIPESLYQEGQVESYFQLQGTDLNEKSISEYQSRNSEYRIISNYPSILNEAFTRGEVLTDLCPILASNSPDNKSRLHVVLRDEQVDIILFKKEVVLMNRFSADHENDILYFCVAAVEQIGIHIDDVAINLSGNVEKLESLHRLIARYFKKLQMLSTPKKVSVPYGFKEVDPVNCWPTLNAHLCV